MRATNKAGKKCTEPVLKCLTPKVVRFISNQSLCNRRDTRMLGIAYNH